MNIDVNGTSFTHNEILRDYDSHRIWLRPLVRILRRGELFYNGGDTSNRKAWNRMDWIDYWRVMTNTPDNILTCPHCGKQIFAHWDELTLEQKKRFNKNDDQAVGGHVTLTPNSEDFWIVPLCKEANRQPANTRFVSKIDIKIVKEKHPVID